MISFFRRFLSSPWVLGLFALVLVAFLITGVNTRLSGTGGGAAEPQGDAVATIGNQSISAEDVVGQAQQIVQQANQRNPGATMAAFVAQGLVEKTVGQLLDATAISLLGQKTGVVASKRLIDAQIASIPAFKDPTGKFDMTRYRALLAERHLSDAVLRRELAGDIVSRQMISPVSGAAREPLGVAMPYAALLVERRAGSWGLVPAGAVPAGPPPSDAEIQAFYRANIARYTLPERRSLRYAVFGRDTVAAAAKPSDADVAAAYAKKAADYASKAERTLSQVVFTGPDAQAKAAALAAQVKGGASFATAAGPNLIKVGEKTQAEFADFASPEVAAAAFAAPVGGTSAPARSAFGWHVVHVDAARTIPGKTLAQVHDELAAALTKERSDAALAKLGADIQDQLGSGATFDDVARRNGLKVVTTPPLLPTGIAINQPGYVPPPEVAPLLKAAFQADPQDAPDIQAVRPGELFALLQVGSVDPAAPQPLAKVRETVVADLQTSNRAARARAIAAAILAKVNAGTPIATAFAGAGVPLPPVQSGGGTRVDIGRQPNIPSPVRLLFTMLPGKAKLLPAPGNGGWYVVRLDTVQTSDPNTIPGLVPQTRAQFNGLLGDEYAQQLANAARAIFPPRQNDKAIAAVKARLLGNPQ